MEQVGYETYCKLLDQVVKEMQGIEVEEDIDVQIDLNISGYIPESYIEDGKQKIEIYQDIALCREDKDIEDVIDEINDRYGTMPKEVENLIEIARIKILCKKANVIKIIQKDSSIMIFVNQKNTNIDEEKINKLIHEFGNNLRFSPGAQTYITLKLGKKDEKDIIKEIKSFLVCL